MKGTRTFNFADDFVFNGSRDLIDAIFETLGFSDEIEVAAIAFDEATILDFRVSVVMVVA